VGRVSTDIASLPNPDVGGISTDIASWPNPDVSGIYRLSQMT